MSSQKTGHHRDIEKQISGSRSVRDPVSASCTVPEELSSSLHTHVHTCACVNTCAHVNLCAPEQIHSYIQIDVCARALSHMCMYMCICVQIMEVYTCNSEHSEG